MSTSIEKLLEGISLENLDSKNGKIIRDFINLIPKAELHVHIEGTLQPELMFKFAKRNNIKLQYNSVSEITNAYNFRDLQSFLDIYYSGTKVLLEEDDFYDLTWSYVEKLKDQNVLHVEISFDPQAHILRGIPFKKVIKGISRALDDAKEKYNLSSKLIMCFLRHLSCESAMETLEQALDYKESIIAVGLDSAELGNPPRKFEKVFSKAREYGFLTVAHAGEEGPPEYIWEALKFLDVKRVDHGVKALEDKVLVKELVKSKVPLTVCPYSNVKLKVFNSLKEHNLKKLMDEGLMITINSDDPAYFNGHLIDNLIGIQSAFEFSFQDIYNLSKNSFISSFLSKKDKEKFVNSLDNFVKKFFL